MAEQMKESPNSPRLPEADCAAAADDDSESSYGSESHPANRSFGSDEFGEEEIEAANQLLCMMEQEEPKADAWAGPFESQLVADEEEGTSSGEAGNELSESQIGAVEEAGTSGRGGGGGEEINGCPGRHVDWDERRRRERKDKNLRVARKYAEFFARFDPHDAEGHSYFRRRYDSSFQDLPVSNQSQDPPLETSKDAQLPLWQPSRSPADDTSFHNRSPPSLLDLCLPVLADNAECIESLQGMPDSLRFQLSAAICGRRKMDSKVLSLFFQGESSEIRIPDCSGVSEEELTRILAQFEPCNLEKLHLGLCGRAMSEQCLLSTVARPTNFLPVTSVSLPGAYRLNDKGLEALLRTTPLLTCLDLSQCSLLTEVGIRAAIDCIWTDLEILVLDGCNQLDVTKLSSSLVRLKKLQKLSLTSIGGMNDKIVNELVQQLGSHLQELCLASCSSLTDAAITAVGAHCPSLKVLKLDHLPLLTDSAVSSIHGCKKIQILSLTRGKFSDEAVVAFVTASGSWLSELSLNAVRLVTDQTLFALAQHSNVCLRRLDASWCRKMSDDGFGFLADTCPNLCELVLFGCTQVTNRFLNGHINPNLKVIR